MRWSRHTPSDDAGQGADPDPQDVEELLALLDTVSDRVDTLDKLVGEDVGVQENRAIHRGRAHLARSEARQVREEVAEVRRRARAVAAQARTVRATSRADGTGRADLPGATGWDPHPAGDPEAGLVEQARHIDASVRWAQLCRPAPSGLTTWSSGDPAPEAVAAIEEGPRAAVLAGADAVVVNETDEHWAAVRAAASRCGVRSVLGLVVPGTTPRAALVLASSQDGAFAAGKPGRVVAELFARHAARTLRDDPREAAAEEQERTREALDGARAVLGHHLGIGAEATFEALFEVARAADEPVLTTAHRVLATLVAPTVGMAPAEPAQLRRAVAYIHENVARPIGLDDIVRQAGIGDRRLQQLFRRHRGCSPLEYLRRVRLDHAHEELEALDPASGTTVADVASRWRFTHPGRFSVAYRERFGRSPSATLRA